MNLWALWSLNWHLPVSRHDESLQLRQHAHVAVAIVGRDGYDERLLLWLAYCDIDDLNEEKYDADADDATKCRSHR